MSETRLDVIVNTRGQRELDRLYAASKKLDEQFDQVRRTAPRLDGALRRAGSAAGAAVPRTNALADAMGRLGRSAQTAVGKLQTMKGAIAALGVGALASWALDQGRQMELLNKRFETLIGTADGAKKVLADLQEINRKSPFELKDLAGAAANLSAFGVETENLVKTTERLGKISAATGRDIDGIALAYGQTLAKGKLQGEELLQFQERGIPLQKELARMLGVTTAEVVELTSKGRIGFPLVEKAIANMTEGTGRFANAFENTSDSIDAQLSNMRDNFSRSAAKLVLAFKGPINWLINRISDVANYFGQVFDRIERMKRGENVAADEMAARTTATRAIQRKYGAAWGFNGQANKEFDARYKAELGNLRAGRELNRLTVGNITPPSERPVELTAAEQAANRQMLLGGNKPGGGGGGTGSGTRSGGGAAATAPKLPSSISKEQFRQWLYSQGMGRTSGDFTNAGHRTPNHMLNAMDMGFTHPRYDHNYVQKTIEMERKLRATGAFGNQLFGPERDPKGHKDHLHIPTPGGRVKMTPGLASLMGLQGAGPEGNMALQQNLMELEAERQKLRDESLATGNKLIQQEERRLQLLQATGEYDKELLQIKFEQEDRLAEIAGLQDAAQKEKLTTLVNQTAELERQLALMDEIKRQVSQPTVFQPQKTEPGKLQSYLDQTRKNLADIDGQMAQVAQTLEGGLANGMANAVSAIVQGTGSIKKAFSDMFMSIGQSFVQMATQMLAQRMILGLFGGLGGMFGGGGGIGNIGFSSNVPNFLGMFGGSAAPVSGFSMSGGGYTGDAPRSGGVDGEGGFPAILHPQETVIDHSRLRGGMGGKSGGGGVSPINLNVTATKIGGEEFVKVNDLQVALRNSEKRAAAQGEQRAMAKLQNSPRTRGKLGLR